MDKIMTKTTPNVLDDNEPSVRKETTSKKDGIETIDITFNNGTEETITSWLESASDLMPPLPSQQPIKQDPIRQTQNDAYLASLIYKINTEKGKEELYKRLPGYEVIAITTDLDPKDEDHLHQYQAVAAINHTTKEVIVITAGTRLSSGIKNLLSDARDDLHLGIGFYPQKVYAAQRLNDRILKKLGNENIKDYHFHYTGHSLGAALSDSAATDMGIKLHTLGLLTKNKVSTVTFDNPGAYTLVQTQLKTHYLKGKQVEAKRHADEMNKISKMKGSKWLGATSEQQLAKTQAINIEKNRHEKELKQISEAKLTLNDEWRKKVNYKAFNNRPNIINTADKQAGETFVIVPKEQQSRNSFFTFVGYVAQKCPGKIVRKILKLISYGSTLEQINEHSIDNFINVISQESGKLIYKNINGGEEISLLDAAYNIKPVKYQKELFESLKIIISARPEGSLHHKETTYSMTDQTPDKDFGHRIEFTAAELDEAKKTIHHHKDADEYKKTDYKADKTSTPPPPDPQQKSYSPSRNNLSYNSWIRAFVGAVIGGAVGFFIAGPVGAAVGFMIGAGISYDDNKYYKNHNNSKASLAPIPPKHANSEDIQILQKEIKQFRQDGLGVRASITPRRERQNVGSIGNKRSSHGPVRKI